MKSFGKGNLTQAQVLYVSAIATFPTPRRHEQPGSVLPQTQPVSAYSVILLWNISLIDDDAV